MTVTGVIQALALVAIPALAHAAAGRFRFARAIGPVGICYLVGMAAANSKLTLEPDVSQATAAVAVLFSIPLLLVSVDYVSWLRLARSTIEAFALCLVSVVVTAVVAGALFGQRVTEGWKVAGMLVGVFTGGTPNLAAVGTALHASPDTLLAAHLSDVLVCSPYFFFLLALAPRLYSRFLPSFRPGPGAASSPRREDGSRTSLPDVLRSLALGALLVLIGALVSKIAPADFREVVAILAVTSVAVAASFHRGVRKMAGSTVVGDYALLVFCVAVGTLAQISRVTSGSNGALLLFTATVLVASTLLHLALCAWRRIDRDTAIITSVAAVFSPAFVPPVADALANREIVPSGVLTGLIGFAVGTYLGIAVAYLVRMLT